MSYFLFAAQSGTLSLSERRRLDQAARELGVGFIYADLADGPRYWFAAESRGNVENAKLEASVIAELHRLGLRRSDGRKKIWARREF